MILKCKVGMNTGEGLGGGGGWKVVMAHCFKKSQFMMGVQKNVNSFAGIAPLDVWWYPEFPPVTIDVKAFESRPCAAAMTLH